MRVFNSEFEVSLRILIILSELKPKQLSLEKIESYDFASIFGKALGISEYNLNGDGLYSFAEFLSRRPRIEESLRNLVLSGLALATAGKNGFLYSASEQGIAAAGNLKNSYAIKYKYELKKAVSFFRHISDEEMIATISDMAVRDLRK